MRKTLNISINTKKTNVSVIILDQNLFIFWIVDKILTKSGRSTSTESAP